MGTLGIPQVLRQEKFLIVAFAVAIAMAGRLVPCSGDALHRSDTDAVQLGGLQHASAASQRGPDSRFDVSGYLGPPECFALALACASPARTRS